MLPSRRLRIVWTLVALVLVVATAVLFGTTDGQLFASTLSTQARNLAYQPSSAIQNFHVGLPTFFQAIDMAKAESTSTPASTMTAETVLSRTLSSRGMAVDHPFEVPTDAPTSTATATNVPSITPTVSDMGKDPPLATFTSAPASKPAAKTVPSNTPMTRATATGVIPTMTATPSRRLVFDDEFGGTQLDASKWHTELTWGRTNPPEAQYYAPDAFNLGSGVLRIKAEKRPMQGYAYTSGIISSYGLFAFTYGYVEARARLPKGQGMWPAFWLLAANGKSYNEIDIMEMLGNEPQRVYTTLHYNGPQGKPQQIGSNFAGPDFSQDFHTFAVNWSPAAVIWYIDGIERFRVTQNVPQEPMYVLANLAVGGIWPGYPNATTVFPAYYDIDYIRVYK